MTVGSVLGEAAEYYQRFFWRFFLISAAIFVVLDLLSAIAIDARGKSAGLGLVWGVVSVSASLVGSFWVQGALVAAVGDVRDGRPDLTVAELYRRTRPFVMPLLVAGILAGVAIAIGLILFIVPGLILLTRWALLVPVIVLERRGALPAFRRSTELVSGHGWQVLGVVLLTTVLAFVASGALIVFFSFLPAFVGNWLGGLVAHSLVTPFVSLAWTVTYFRLRELESPGRRVVTTS